MDLAPTETQHLVRDSIRDFLTREVPFSRVRQVERAGGHDADLWASLQALGWLGLPFSSAHGGSDGALTDFAVLLEELARRAVLVPIAETMAAGLTIERFGDKALAGDIVPKIIGGSAIAVPAILEASDSYDDVRAEVKGGRLSGEKYFVDYAQSATHHLVAARDGRDVALFLVDANHASVSMRPLRTTGKIPQAIVRYDGAPATPVCGANGFAHLQQLGRAFATIECLACAQQALDMTVEYVGMRVQFGRPIGTFQAVQHHCANMATAVEATRFLAYEAIDAIGRGVATEEQLAIAKAAASRTVTEVTMLAHQLHGGIGIMEEYDLHFFALRGKQRALSWGSAEECLTTVSNSVEEDVPWL